MLFRKYVGRPPEVAVLRLWGRVSSSLINPPQRTKVHLDSWQFRSTAGYLSRLTHPLGRMAKAGRRPTNFSEHSEKNPLPDSESDSEDELANVAVGPYMGSVLRSQVIHSGHFMVSSPHSDATIRRRKSGATDYNTANRTGCQTYRFGPFSSGSLSIDPTLTRLFECMTLAYR